MMTTMKTTKTLAILAALGLALGASACKKKDAEATAEATSPESSGQAKPSDASGAAKTPEAPKADAEDEWGEEEGDKPKKAAVSGDFKPTLDEEVVAAIDAVIKNCKEVKYKRGNDCPDKEQEKYDQLLYKKGPAAVDTVVAIFSDSSQSAPRRQLAAHALNYPLNSAFSKMEKGEGKVDPAAFKALAKAVQAEDVADKEKLAIATIPAAVHLGNLAKLHDEVRALISSFDPSKGDDHMWVRYHGLEHVMQFGRMEHFAFVKEHVEGDNAHLQRAAFSAPRKMSEWSDAEDKEICAWSEGYLSKDDSQWNAGPSWILLRCKDREKYADMIIEEAKTRGKDKTFARPFIFAFRELCSRGFFGTGTKTSDEQCARAKKLLQIATDDEKLKDFERAMALSSIAYQWRDEESLKLMKKYMSHKNPEIAKMATSSAESLEKQLKSAAERKDGASKEAAPKKAPKKN